MHSEKNHIENHRPVRRNPAPQAAYSKKPAPNPSVKNISNKKPVQGSTAVRPQTRKKQRISIGALLTLIFCFPAGLFVMWRKTRWPRFIKSAVTAAVCALLIAVLLPVTNPPERETGGISLVGEKPMADIHGPEAPADREVIEIYVPRYTSIILEATPTPAPVTVYCNNGGAHYHSQDCKYVTANTPTATLQRAIEAGYTQCTECDAPSPY